MGRTEVEAFAALVRLLATIATNYDTGEARFREGPISLFLAGISCNEPVCMFIGVENLVTGPRHGDLHGKHTEPLAQIWVKERKAAIPKDSGLFADR